MGLLGTKVLGRECPAVPQRRQAGHGPAHLLLQTDAKLLGGQGGPRRRCLGGRGGPALVQAPKLLIVPADTAGARLSPCRGGASGHRGRMPRTAASSGPMCHSAISHVCMCTHAHAHSPRYHGCSRRRPREQANPSLSCEPPANVSPTCLHEGFHLPGAPSRSLLTWQPPLETHFRTHLLLEASPGISSPLAPSLPP